jgi:hypothetical protein
MEKENKKTKYSDVRKEVISILKDKKAFDAGNTILGNVIWEAGKKLFLDTLGINEGNFLSYLSKIKGESDSGVYRREGGQGYYYVETPNISQSESDSLDENDYENDSLSPEENKRQRREESLYPALKTWLMTFQYRVDITANRRHRRSHLWSIPDVTGIYINEYLSTTDIGEIATIEVKTTKDRWYTDIFEAIAHKRFSNRIYFAFAADQENYEKIQADSDLRYYAELYEVGVLVILLNKETFRSLVKDEQLPNNLIKDDEEVRIVYSAPYSAKTQKQYQIAFCKNVLEIASQKDLFAWGDIIEDS